MKILAYPLFFALMASPATAQTPIKLKTFNNDSVVLAIRCELSAFAKGPGKGLPGDSKARFSFKYVDEANENASADASAGVSQYFGLAGGVSGGMASRQSSTVGIDLSLTDPSPVQGCVKGMQNVGAYNCFEQTVDTIRRKGFFTCGGAATAFAQLSANGAIVAWYVNIAGDANLALKRSYQIAIEYPNPADRKFGTFETAPEPYKPERKKFLGGYN